MQRNLTITLEPDWKAALRATAKFAKAKTYQGEVLNFETPAQFFGQLTERRWELVRTKQGGLVCPFASMHIDMFWRRRKDAFVILALLQAAHPLTSASLLR